MPRAVYARHPNLAHAPPHGSGSSDGREASALARCSHIALQRLQVRAPGTSHSSAAPASSRPAAAPTRGTDHGRFFSDLRVRDASKPWAIVAHTPRLTHSHNTCIISR